MKNILKGDIIEKYFLPNPKLHQWIIAPRLAVSNVRRETSLRKDPKKYDNVHGKKGIQYHQQS